MSVNRKVDGGPSTPARAPGGAGASRSVTGYPRTGVAAMPPRSAPASRHGASAVTGSTDTGLKDPGVGTRHMAAIVLQPVSSLSRRTAGARWLGTSVCQRHGAGPGYSTTSDQAPIIGVPCVPAARLTARPRSVGAFPWPASDSCPPSRPSPGSHRTRSRASRRSRSRWGSRTTTRSRPTSSWTSRSCAERTDSGRQTSSGPSSRSRTDGSSGTAISGRGTSARPPSGSARPPCASRPCTFPTSAQIQRSRPRRCGSSRRWADGWASRPHDPFATSHSCSSGHRSPGRRWHSP